MPGVAASSEVSGTTNPGKYQGPDGRWMLKLIYPNAVSLDSYLEVWLRDIAAAAAAPGSASAAAIDGCGGPASYLSRKDDEEEFKKVGRMGAILQVLVVTYLGSKPAPRPGPVCGAIMRHVSA